MESHLYFLGCLSPDGAVYDYEGLLNTDCLVKLCRLDLKCPDANWKTLPSKTFPNRCDPSLIPLDGKLYALGSFLDSIFLQKAAIEGLGWTKAFDPISNAWEPLLLAFPPYSFPAIYIAIPSKKSNSCSSY